MEPCAHMTAAAPADPRGGPECPACVELGDTWVHLRVCATCGNVGCCDSSKNRHATKHAGATDHPVVRSYEPGEAWWFCYPDDLMVPDVPGYPALRERG